MMANITVTAKSCANITDSQVAELKLALTPEIFGATEATVLTAAYVLISLLGVIGNGLVCFVVIRAKKMRTIRNVFIANMSLANFMFAMVLVPLLWLPRLENYWHYGDLLCKEVNSMAGMNLFCSAFTIIACAADRYFAVSSRRVSNTLSHGQAGGILVSIWGISGLFSVPFWMYYQVKEVFYDEFCYPFNQVVLRRTCDLVMPPEVSMAVGVLQALFLLPIPLLALAIFNWKLSRFLQQNRQLNLALRHTKSDGQKRNRTNVLLFAMAASYALLWMPFTTIVILGDVAQEFMSTISNPIFVRIEVTFHVLSSFSVCVNPFLYGFLNCNFNAAFHEIWRCIWRRRKNSSTSHLLPKGKNLNGLIIPIGPMEPLRKKAPRKALKKYSITADINNGTLTTVLEGNT